MDDRKFDRRVGMWYCLAVMLISSLGIPLAIVQHCGNQIPIDFNSPLAERDDGDPPQIPKVSPLPEPTLLEARPSEPTPQESTPNKFLNVCEQTSAPSTDDCQLPTANSLTPKIDPEAFETPSLPVYSTKPPQTPREAFYRSEVFVVIGEGCGPCRVVLENLVPALVYRGWHVTLVPNATTIGGPIPRFEIRAYGWTQAELHEGLMTIDQFNSIFENHTEP
jgi:hypothetical protein